MQNEPTKLYLVQWATDSGFYTGPELASLAAFLRRKGERITDIVEVA